MPCRNLILFLFFLSAGLSCALPLSAQVDRSRYALLWEISGNGLERPSYLFGSMHIRHKDIFEFPDSLFYYIERCEAFANEIHLDSAMNRFFDLAMSETRHYSKGKLTMLPPDGLRPDSSGRRAAFAPPRRKTQQGMPTMLDAYLMNVARAQGKVLYGLENIDEHLGIDDVKGGFSGSPREFGFSGGETGLEELIDIYQSGDLDRISNYIDTHGGGEDVDLIPRNYIMAESIERITQGHSLFAVVGAAHLPGKEGVVQLLQERGYKVKKVSPSFRGLARQYEYAPRERAWYRTESPDASYAFETPLPAQPVGRKNLNSYYITFDLGDGMGYVVSAEYLLPGAYYNFERQYFEDNGFKVLSSDTIAISGRLGTEYRLAKPDDDLKYYRARAITVNGRLYYQQFGSFLEQNLYGPEAERFFGSLSLFPVRVAEAQVESVRGAFRAALPTGYTQTSHYEGEGDPEQVSCQGIDGKGNFFAVRFFELDDKAIARYPGDSAVLTAALANAAELFGKKLERTDSAQLWSLPARTGQLSLGPGVKLWVQAFRRGARIYVLTAAGADEARTFFNDFALLPPANAPLWKYQLGQEKFTALWPAEPVKPATAPAWQQRYGKLYPVASAATAQAKDTLSGGAYAVSVLRHPDFFRIAGYEDYYRNLLPVLFPEPHEVLHTRLEAREGGAPVFSAEIQPRQALTAQHLQLELRGDALVVKSLTGSLDWVRGEQAAAFFAGVALDSIYAPADPLQGRPEVFLDRIFDRSLDWEDNYPSQAANYPFDAADLPLLAGYLDPDRWVDGDALNGILRGALLTALAKVDGPGSLGVIRRIWASAPAREAAASGLIAALTAMENPEAAALLLEYIDGNSPEAAAWRELALAQYRGEPARFVRQLPAWMAVASSETLGEIFWQLSALVAETDTAFAAALADGRLDAYLKAAGQALETPHSEASVEAIFRLFSALPQRPAAFDAPAQAFFKRRRADAASLAVMEYLLKGDVDLPQVKMDKLLADSALFVPVIRLLSRYKRMDLAPANRYPAEYIAYQMLLGGLPAKARQLAAPAWIKTRVLGRGPSKSRVYIYRLPLGGNGYGLAAVAGFDPDGKDRFLLAGGKVVYTLEPVALHEIDGRVLNLLGLNEQSQ